MKRLTSRQEIKINTFLITFIFPIVPSSIRMSLYSVRDSPYDPNPVRSVRNLDMIKFTPKGN
jgi:hypothetical protein